MPKSEQPYILVVLRLLISMETQEESGDDLNPVLVSGLGRLSGVGVDGGLTGSASAHWLLFEWCMAINVIGEYPPIMFIESVHSINTNFLGL